MIYESERPFPRLKPVGRDREYNRISKQQRSAVVYDYLFKSRSHRWIDQNVLDQDPEYSRGYLSMGTLHHIGLKREHKGFFVGSSVDEAINLLESQDNQHFHHLILNLAQFKKDNLILPRLDAIQEKFNIDVSKSRFDSVVNRHQRLEEADVQPKPVNVITTVYRRNPDVVAEVLERAQGMCEKCQQPAPFLRAADRTPYLEVHHIITLAEGGNDTVDNAMAVCPNCHRELHYG